MEIAVRFSPLEQQADSLGSCADALERCAGQIRRVRGSLTTAMKTQSNISALLNSAADGVEKRAQSVSRLERGLREVLPLYRACEAALAGAEEDAESKDTTTGQAQTGGDVKGGWNTAWDFADTLGTFGGMVGGIGRIATGGNWAERGKGVADLVGTGAKTVGAIKAGKYGIDDFFGVNSVNPADAVADKMDEFVVGGGKGAWSNVASIAKWAGIALTGVNNLMDNAQEFGGDYGNARVYQEAVIETVVDVGLDIAATAAVGAAATALGITAAPAVVIGAAGVAVVAGANALCKWVTGGKDVGEVVADAVCDTAEAIGKAAGKAAKAVKKGAKAAWKKITSWF